MIKISITLIVFYLLSVHHGLLAQQSYTPSPQNLESRKWFQSAKFGMFIHWGASSVLGDGEWVMNNENIKVNDYKKLVNFFNPQQFDAKKWVSTAKNAGMRYITFITRHHDSFSNWETKYSDWNVGNTPYGKDILKQLADECHKQGIKLFLYYSLLDWYRSDYQYWTGRTGQGTGRTEKGKWEDYITFMKNQLTELLSNYGEIAGIWFDGHWDQVSYNEITKKWEGGSKVDWHYNEIYSLIHKLQPHALVGNNHHLSPIDGEDFQMFERDLPGQNTTGWGTDVNSVSSLPLETCETINNSWGFNIKDNTYKSAKEIIHLLVKAAGLNANLLLNIGPMPNGEVQPEFVSRLDSVGKWMNRFGESVYETSGGIVTDLPWGTVTGKGGTLYIHLLDTASQKISIDNFPYKKILKLTTLADGQEVKYKLEKTKLSIDVSSIKKEENDTVLKMEVKQ